MHPKFGKQFKATAVSEVRPETADGMVRYLGSGVIKGIGPVLAMRLVNAFGLKTFDVIEYTPNRLSEVPGISKKKAIEISEAYGKIKIMQDAVMFLQKYGITLNTALKIYAAYGKDTVQLVSKNPYSLIEDVDGIGFYSADKIAQSRALPKTERSAFAPALFLRLKKALVRAATLFFPKTSLSHTYPTFFRWKPTVSFRLSNSLFRRENCADSSLKSRR